MITLGLAVLGVMAIIATGICFVIFMDRKAYRKKRETRQAEAEARAAKDLILEKDLSRVEMVKMLKKKMESSTLKKLIYDTPSDWLSIQQVDTKVICLNRDLFFAFDPHSDDKTPIVRIATNVPKKYSDPSSDYYESRCQTLMHLIYYGCSINSFTQYDQFELSKINIVSLKITQKEYLQLRQLTEDKLDVQQNHKSHHDLNVMKQKLS